MGSVLSVKRKRILKYLAVLLGLVIFLYYENNFLGITGIDTKFKRLPQSFEGFKIVHLSDLHSKMFGKDQYDLVSEIKKIRPDIIVFTGDLIDSRHYDEQPALKLMNEILGIAPVYYVTGNHESRSGRFASLEKQLRQLGVRVLRNTRESIERNGDKIDIIGADDPSFSNSRLYYEDEKAASSEIQKALEGGTQQNFKILLSHRPELLSTYARYGIDLTFSGHAHGGQVRLPFVGGIVAPDQGLLPKYTSGKYQEGNSLMIVSRGLGNSIIPQRIFNRPEIVVVRLGKE